MIGVLALFVGISLAAFTIVDIVKDPPKIEPKVHENQGQYND